MKDFLIFKSFISPTMLIVFYYFGAIIMPIFIWFFCRFIMLKIFLFKQSHTVVNQIVWKSMKLKYKFVFIILFILLFIFMQIIWRMIFEFLIAYMQIRDALII